MTQKTETVGAETHTYDYHYDPAGRLIEVREGGDIVSQYTYDSNGNRLSYSNGVNAVDGTYDTQDRLTRYGDTDYAYTADGKLFSKTTAGQTTAYQYDVLGNLLSGHSPGQHTH